MTTLDNRLQEYIEDERDDEPTVKFVKSYSSPTIETQAEAAKMCLDILNNVPEPAEPEARKLWKEAKNALVRVYTEVSLNDTEWQSAPPPAGARHG